MENGGFRQRRGVLAGLSLIAALSTLAASTTASVGQNSITLGLMTGGVGGTYAQIGQNIADVFAEGDIRVVPMLGRGSVQNIQDLLYMNGVDVAIVQSDVLDWFRSNGDNENIVDSIAYIAKLYNEEIHVLTRGDVFSLKDLDGRPVSIGRAGSGTAMTAGNLFEVMEIEPAQTYNFGGAEAVDALRDGTTDAAFFVVGRPSGLLSNIEPDAGLTLLSFEMPKEFDGPYFTAEFTSVDYPALIPEGETVSTISVGAILAVYRWSEGSRRWYFLKVFAEELLNLLPILQSGSYHQRWQDFDDTVEISGWQRF